MLDVNAVSNECRYAKVLQETHDEEHLIKFEELLEAAIDLDRIPDEYLVCASYDPGLEVQPCRRHMRALLAAICVLKAVYVCTDSCM